MTKEEALLLMLDNSAGLLDTVRIFDGSVNATALSARKIAEVAFSRNAARIVLAHNHPDGVAEPSDEDITTTRMLRRAFAMIDLPLDEHIIVAGNRYYPILTELERMADLRKT